MTDRERMRRCFLCGRNGSGDRLELHHIFGGPRRPLSDKYGLTVYLCGSRCHRDGPYSAHKNPEVADFLHRYGQQKAMAEQGWTADEFREIFGKNYLKE